ncbi:MAG TPA: TRAM domain-containing protein [Nocardioidaceae bacterium]|nr:TRAM domain-containing protein [Nocardioidaceae bacterium]
MSRVGQRYDVRTDRIAHGGFAVARHEGVVVFVRHALPGERVVAEVTEGREGDRFLRADAVEVLEPSPDRVEPPCPYARPGRCGGCDLQHATLPAQRALKAAVVSEQLQRLAGLDVDVEVEPVPGDTHGLGWRTRVQWAVTPDGTPGLRRHRSHEVVPVDRCLIASDELPDVVGSSWPQASSVEAIVSATGQRLRLATTRDGSTYADGPLVLREQAVGRPWQVTGSGFWQVHPGAADALVTAVLEGIAPAQGEHALDLYSGVGLFAAALADAVGPTGHVLAVESDAGAAADAAVNLADLPQVAVLQQRVDRALTGTGGSGPQVRSADLVVLDPPRTGAKRDVVAGIAALKPRAVGYVACDPAALARDVSYFAAHGYALSSLRAFDLFPMTSHVECVAHLVKG